MSWIEVHEELCGHHKTVNMCHILGISRVQAMGHLICLWHYTLRYAWRDGDLSAWGEHGVEEACRWEGAPGAMVAALQSCGKKEGDGRAPGYLDGLVVHDWILHCGRLIKDRLGAEARRTFSRQPRQELETTYAPFKDAWNAFATKMKLGPVQSVSARRAALIQSSGMTPEQFTEVLAAAERQPFLMGAGDGGWKIDMDWVLSGDHSARILEKKYLREPKASMPAGPTGSDVRTRTKELLDRRKAQA